MRSRRLNARRFQAGFTLLEAIVALVLVAGAGAVLFSWVNDSVVSLGRLSEQHLRQAAMENVLSYMQGVNPMTDPTGDMDFASYRIRWQSTPVVDERDNSNYPGGTGFFRVGLYEVTVTADRGDQAKWFEMKLRLFGSKKVRERRLLI